MLAGPVEATVAQLGELASLRPGPSAVFDVASVKAPVTAAAAAAAIENFVATHPIAGSERSGPAAARADLFAGRTWTYDPSANPQALRVVLETVQALGARPFAIGSAEHDRTIALTSHLPQILSVALGSALEERLDELQVRELCGTGMRSMLRLSDSSWAMWRAVLAANSVSLAQEVRRLAAILGEAAGALETGESDRLRDRFSSAARAVNRLNEPDHRKADS